MTPEQAYAEALRRIEAAAASGQDWLDLGDLPLDAIPPEIGRLASQLRQLGLGIYGYDTQQADWTYDSERRSTSRSFNDLRPLSGLAALQFLDMNGCAQLASLEPIARLTALQSLNVSECWEITSLKPIAGLTALQSLDVKRCPRIRSLAPLAGLTALQSLDMSRCFQITSLEPLSGLSALQLLDVNGCGRITSLEPLAGLTALRSLIIRHCYRITSLEPIARHAELKSLDIRGCNRLTSLEPIAELTALQSLDMSRCYQITSLKPIAELTALLSLNVNNCKKITSLEPITELTALQSLDMCRCYQITSLEPIAELTALQSLHVSWCNQLTSLEPIAGLTALQSLDVSYCKQLTSLDPIAGLNSLKTLNLYGVPISQNLTTEVLLHQWPALSVLITDRLHAAPPEVVSSRYDNCLPRLIPWWHDLQQGEADSHELKLFILGNGRVGKSELLRRLRGDAFHGDLPSTHGIQLDRFEVCRHYDDRPIFLNAWDFGGQDVYLGTHALFLKSRAIFVLAWHPDMETDAPYTEAVSGLEMRHRPLQYWLDYIHSLAGDEARVIVVQTQCARESDEAAPPLKNTECLAWYRPTISCASQDDGVDSLRDLLKRAARHRLETPAPPRMPASWLAVRDRLVALRETDRTIDRARFDAICADTHHGASSEALLHYLHQAGDVFHQPGLFGDAIVLDQQWALDGIYTLFDRGRVLPLLRGHNGIFAPEMLDALAWNDHYSTKEQALLLSMMASCDLIFPVHQWDETRYYVMIDALPDASASANRIAMVWPADAPAVEAVADYAFLHDGVLRALLARIGHLAGRDAVYWRHGVCLYDAGTACRARIDTEQRADGSGLVRMRATGRDAEALCERLVALLKDIRIGEPPKITRDDASGPSAPPRHSSQGERDMLQPAPIPPLPGQKPAVYFSYAWGGDDRKDLKAFAVRLHRSLEDEFDVRRDEDATRPGDRISEFMREIGRGTRVLVLLSDKYVRSANCMQELSYLYDRHRADRHGLDDHVLPLIVDKDFRCGTEQRLGYVRHWKNELARLKALTVGLEPHECLSAFEEIQAINRFVGMTDQVLKFMGDVLMPRGDDLPSEDFAAVKAALRRLGGE
ncbi:MAG: leucine-rich repeat domain-containing protein [Xanthomonadaceae bacterium]|nr:leucine-rich repeat domain-containing protein [Xanthomonadaceae bacterium]